MKAVETVYESLDLLAVELPLDLDFSSQDLERIHTFTFQLLQVTFQGLEDISHDDIGYDQISARDIHRIQLSDYKRIHLCLYITLPVLPLPDVITVDPVQTVCETSLVYSLVVEEYVGIDFGAITDDAEAVAAAKAKGVELSDAAEKTWGNALYACFDQRVEEHLIQPTFITMYPVEVSPLTKRSPADPRLTERFEAFICHSEMGNAYSELNDPIDQRDRFMKQVEQRERGDDETEMMDEDFLNAMEYGMPPTGGMGIGVDRTVMLLTGSDSIREVILFPTMKPQD